MNEDHALILFQSQLLRQRFARIARCRWSLNSQWRGSPQNRINGRRQFFTIAKACGREQATSWADPLRGAANEDNRQSSFFFGFPKSRRNGLTVGRQSIQGNDKNVRWRRVPPHRGVGAPMNMHIVTGRTQRLSVLGRLALMPMQISDFGQTAPLSPAYPSCSLAGPHGLARVAVMIYTEGVHSRCPRPSSHWELL